MKYGIRVLPKEEVLDSQGRAVQGVLEKKGFDLSQCKVGRYIVLETDSGKEQIREMADYVLFNPLIEQIEIEELS